jgi:radical SAM superfamily enzyme YgiQ (UPF0313 family)
MKVFLISPPKLETLTGASTIPPLGLIYVAGVLKKNNIEVKITDVEAEEISYDKLISRVLNFRPDIIGISATTSAYPFALKTLKEIKEKNKKTPIVLGGSHGTFLPDEALKDGFDFVIRGEGEYTLLELCKNNFKDLEKIQGLSYKKDNKIIHNPDRPFIKDLDEIPFPAYDLLPIKCYQNMTPPSNVRKRPWVSYCSSRGCPIGCIFCSVTHFWGRIWRGHSPERMVDDIEHLIKTYGIKTIFFVDDNFTFKRDRIMKFCKLIKERGLKFEWSCSCRVDQIDEELLREMKSSGCWLIGFGVESGEQRVIDWYGKKITTLQARRAARICKKLGIFIFCFFVMGAPVETEKDILRTIKLAKELNPKIFGLGFLAPYPGSDLYKYSFENEIVLTKNYEEYDQVLPVLKTPISQERLIELSRKAYREYYFRPKYIYSQLDSLLNPKLLLQGIKTIWQRVTIKK